MTDRMDTEALRALVGDLRQYHFDKEADVMEALAAEVLELRAKLEDFKSSQHYRYIGKDGKPVLARDLEDRATKAEAAVKHANDHADAAIADLAAEKVLADQIYEALIYERTIDRAASIRAYRKARGM